MSLDSCRFSLLAQTRGPWAYYQKLYEKQKQELEDVKYQLERSEENCKLLEECKYKSDEQIQLNQKQLNALQISFTSLKSNFQQFQEEQQRIISDLAKQFALIVSENKRLTSTLEAQNKQFQNLEFAQINWGEKIQKVSKQLNLSESESFYFIQDLENLRIDCAQQQKQIQNLSSDNRILSDKCEHYRDHNSTLIEENSRLMKNVTFLRQELLQQQVKNTKLVEQMYGKKKQLKKF
eukprot:TRINITY_DN3070_c0_g1_i2.p1 TRINITY_DN3070_c0_g1~~TRINITY_DN3070_c0_g1_i2.p1  ORF type:complete len:236 (-),score=27.50 TRINITY_DN3070_c0_g1_i2:311-1018(-)